jgi:hypothetical protein
MAWTKYGEGAFEFEILEECGRDLIEEREQFYLDTLKPALNIVIDATRHVSDRHMAALIAFNRARFAAITHCPRGHVYDQANTYINKKGKRICRACNALRVAAIYEQQSESERRQRLKRYRDDYRQHREHRLVALKAYAAAHKAEKREYDRLRRESLKTENLHGGEQ